MSQADSSPAPTAEHASNHTSTTTQHHHEDDDGQESTTVRCQCGKLPLLLRRGIRVQDLRQIYELNEQALAVGYDAPYYESLFTNKLVVVIVALTTAAAYRAATAAASTHDATSSSAGHVEGDACDGHGASNEGNTASSHAAVQPQPQAISEANQSPGLFSIDLEACQRRAIVEQFIAYKEYEAGLSTCSLFSLQWLQSAALRGGRALRAFAARLMGIHIANPCDEARQAAHSTTTRATRRNTRKGSTLRDDEADEDDDDDAYTVVVGCITGFISYAQYDEAKWVCANPTGYIATFAVTQALRRTGVGSLLLEHCLRYMTCELPLTMSSYLHYDEAAAEAMLADILHTMQKSNNNNNNIENSSRRAEAVGEESGSAHRPAHTVSLGKHTRGQAGTMVLQHGVGEVWLNCIADSAAVVHFYTQRGFRVTRRMSQYYHIDDQDHDGLMLVYSRPAANHASVADEDTMNKDNTSVSTLAHDGPVHRGCSTRADKGRRARDECRGECDMDAVREELRRRFLGPLQEPVSHVASHTSSARRRGKEREQHAHTRSQHISHPTSSSPSSSSSSYSYMPPLGVWLRPRLYDAVQQVSCWNDEVYRRIWQRQRMYRPDTDLTLDGMPGMNEGNSNSNTWQEVVHQVVLTVNAVALLLLVLYVCYRLVVSSSSYGV